MIPASTLLSVPFDEILTEIEKRHPVRERDGRKQLLGPGLRILLWILKAVLSLLLLWGFLQLLQMVG